jgi:hypothetical protein
MRFWGGKSNGFFDKNNNEALKKNKFKKLLIKWVTISNKLKLKEMAGDFF